MGITGITAYSIIVSVLFYNLSLIVVSLLCRSGAIRAKHMPTLLLLLTLVGLVRLITPVDVDGAYVIRSYSVLPAIREALSRPLIGFVTPGRLLLLAWGVGTAVKIVRDIRVQREYDQSFPDFDFDDARRLIDILAEFRGNVSLHIAPEAKVPYVSGIICPAINVPSGLDLTDEEWRMVFRHETQHIKAHDELKKLIFLGIEALFWWNPLAHLSAKEINNLIEMRCDAKVMETLNAEEKRVYVGTLEKLMEWVKDRYVPTGALTLIGDKNEMKLRIAALTAKDTPRGRWLTWVFSVLMVTALVLSYRVIIQPAYRYPEEDILTYREGIPVVDNTQDIKAADSMRIVAEDGEYLLYIDGEFFGRLKEDSLSDPLLNSIPYINVPMEEIEGGE